MAQEAGSIPPYGRADRLPTDDVEASPFTEDMTMREQVMDIIEYILADTDPRSERARSKLHRLVQDRPDDPEGVLLEHLIETRKSAAPESEVQAQQESASLHLESSDAAWAVAVPVSHEVRVGIHNPRGQALLTAFQPVHALPEGGVVGVEALTRFVGEDGAGADIWFREAAAAGLGD